MEINYYVFDSIENRGGSYVASRDGKEVEVYPLDDTDEETLVAQGFAKCDAPGTETMIVEETAWATVG